MSFALTVPGTDRLLRRSGDLLVVDDEADSGPVFTSIGADIWDLVAEGRRATLDEFADGYAAVRAAEQRELTPTEVRQLPSMRADHPLAEMWRQRAASHERFRTAIAELQPGKAIDIGAGCGWLAADLARHDWMCAALDVTVEGGDGLAAARHHAEPLLLVRAEMESLPFASDSVDLAVFNASLHYAVSVKAALEEAARVLRPGGMLAVLDSPVFSDSTAGRTMVAELAEHIERVHGLAAAPHEGPGFVTVDDLANFDFHRRDDVGGLHGKLRKWRGARRAGRETAARPLLTSIIGERP